jgi:TonB family protein
MTAFIIKSSLSMILLYGLYWFITRKEKIFVFNRYFLIFSILFSLVIPFISLPVSFLGNNLENNISSVLNYNSSFLYADQEITGSLTSSTADSQAHQGILAGINIKDVIYWIYIAGVSLFLIRFLRNLFLINRKVRSSEKIDYSGHKLVLIDNPVNPHCFLNIIFVDKNRFRNNQIANELIRHEMEHVSQLHSIDIIILELIRIVYWFNPVLILYSRAIRLNHEYLADNGVVKASTDIKSYADKLLNYIMGVSEIPIVSSCNNSLTKKRIIMLSRSRPNSFKKGVRVFLTLNLGVIAFLILNVGASNVRGTETGNTPFLTSGYVQNGIKGIVTDETGKPLEGALISIPSLIGYQAGTSTDSKGQFAVHFPVDGAYVSVSCRGYKSQFLKADFRNEMKIMLVKDPDYKETRPNVTMVPGAQANPQFRRTEPDDYPTFEGKGYTYFIDWIPAQIKYPVEAAQKGIKGRVQVNYTVDPDGVIRNVVFVGQPDKLLGDAVMNAVISAPAWSPAKNPEAKGAFTTGLSVKFIPPNKVVKDDSYVSAEKMPQFPGGDQAIMDFVKNNIKYPDALKTEKITGRVIVRFVINALGTVEDAIVVKGVHPLLDAEALRVVSLLTGWQPASLGGKPVPVYFSMPVNFSL